MKVVAIVQARMGSSRLPGKILRSLDGVTVLELIHKRLSQCRSLHEIVVATSCSEKDDAVEEEMKRLNIPVYRGDENDVLDRYYRVASITQAEAIVRITGDCPLIDPGIVDAVVGKYIDRQPSLDYVSNIHPPTFPDGLDVEVFSFEALERAWKETSNRFDREHVTPFIHGHPEWFPSANLSAPQDYSGLRWTLDEQKDYEFLLALSAKAADLGIPTISATWEAWLNIVEQYPWLAEINSLYQRNEGSNSSSQELGGVAMTEAKGAETG
ncbi:glycosyltransferase family protein [Cohnella mopanensis]|uniref:glycosyltransferase family protein n=1 Tax=Cohnella mopanensis TaxID=2911966 RepID=UPI001EF936EE|nr:glycosyltransferase family protein [Cohnella mopanensis]